MKEASRVKFYLAKYFFLAVAILQASAALVSALKFEDTPRNRSVVIVIAAFSLIFFSLHFLFSTKIKRVATSKKKITIIDQDKIKSYTWEEVKDVKYLSLLNMYTFKLKGKSKRIYFLPSENSGALFGLFANDAPFISKRASKT